MSKELEALDKINDYIVYCVGTYDEMLEYISVIKQALQRLESIDNTKPSEALEILYNNAKLDVNRIEMGGIVTYAEEDDHNSRIKPYYNTIKQVLIQAEEDKKELWDYHNIVIPFLEELANILGNNDLDEILDIIKTKSKKELAFEIIKEKRVDLSYLRCCIEDNQSVERYNKYIRNKTMDYDHEEELTLEEFKLLKEVLE